LILTLVLVLAGPAQGVLLAAPAVAAFPPRADFQKGMSYVGFSNDVFLSPESDASLDRLALTGTKWLSLVPIWYQDDFQSTKISPSADLTPSDASVRHVIKYVKAKGWGVLLKPYVDPLDETWRALIQPTSWSTWFTSYRAFLLHYAQIAQEENVEELSIGTEMASSESQVAEWRNTIAAVRAIYKGKLTYAATHTDVFGLNGKLLGGGYQNIAWWDALDYIGIDAYFGLVPDSGKLTTTVEKKKKGGTTTSVPVDVLIAGWKVALDQVEQWRAARGLTTKPVIFTEIGIQSSRGAAVDPGDFSRTGPVDLELQRAYYESAFRASGDRPWLAGFFWWWWDNPTTGDYLGGPRDNTYTPKGKPAEAELTKWYTGVATRPAR